MSKLYELTDQYLALSEQLNDNTDETLDFVSSLKLAHTLNEIKDQIEVKAENIGKLILNMDSEKTALENEIERLNKRVNAITTRRDGLRQYLLTEMLTIKTEKFRFPLFTIFTRTNPPSVNVLNKEAVPVEFRRVIPETWEVDKKGIIENFKQTGEIPDGCEMVTEKKSLMIK